MKKKTINVGIIGLGTVGSGVLEILINKKKHIKDRTGIEFNVTAVSEKNKNLLKKLKLSSNIKDVKAENLFKNKNIDIVVELIGGLGLAGEFIKSSLNNGKYVVTANKALLAEKGKTLFDLAEKNNLEIRYEAAVAGGIPILKSIREGLAANEINEVYGIINGTANYILTKMVKEKMEFSKALKQAQKLGFAEADPSLDINGGDSAHKALLIAELVCSAYIDFKDIYIEGITNISLQDIIYAEEMNYRIKLIAVVKKLSDSVDVRVHPVLINQNHPLANVWNEYNGVYLSGDAAGQQLYYGKGAGKFPTASAVVSDIVDIGKKIYFREIIPKGLRTKKQFINIFPIQNIKTCYFLKFVTEDKPLVLSKISRILGEHNISIASVMQKDTDNPKAVPIVIITHRALEQDIQEALKKIDTLSVVKKKSSLIRIVTGDGGLQT